MTCGKQTHPLSPEKLSEFILFILLLSSILFSGCGSPEKKQEFKISSVRISSNNVSQFNPDAVNDIIKAGTRFAIAEVTWVNAPPDLVFDVLWYYMDNKTPVYVRREPAGVSGGRKYFYLAFGNDSPLPAGKYRMDIKYGEKILFTKSFRVE